MDEQEMRFPTGSRVDGAGIAFRPVQPDDAEFILSLRLDDQKGRYLSATEDSIEKQREWIAQRMTDPSENYFLIEDNSKRPIGTVRLYDIQGRSFSWGSWILSNEKPKSAAVMSTLMVYAYGLSLGFDRSHFEVVIENELVWQYHERMGAIRTGEDAHKYYYEMSRCAMLDLLTKYASRLPSGITIFNGAIDKGISFDCESLADDNL